jgi:hypothetical protein
VYCRRRPERFGGLSAPQNGTSFGSCALVGQDWRMRQSPTEKPIKKFCRTFEHLQDDSVSCSVAERIERHRGLLGVDELSPLLGLSPKTLYAWVAAGTLPAVRMAYLLWWGHAHNLEPLSVPLSLKRGEYTSPFFFDRPAR